VINILFENEFRSINSYGRRIFNVCIHHSNKFGVIFEGERPVYSWNCDKILNENHFESLRQNKISQFRDDLRQSNFPLIYE
jgi:hypothetical protein